MYAVAVVGYEAADVGVSDSYSLAEGVVAVEVVFVADEDEWW